MGPLRQNAGESEEILRAVEDVQRSLEKLIAVIKAHRTLREELLEQDQRTLYRGVLDDVAVAVVAMPGPVGRPLPKREAEAVSLVGRGLRNAGIAQAMGISENTVKSYLKSVSRRWQVHSRASLARYAAVLYSEEPGKRKRGQIPGSLDS